MSLLIIVLITLVALFASVIAPYDPLSMQIGQSNYPPAWYNTPSKVGHAEHLLGTDRFGRDIFSHAIYGARVAMFLALIAIPLTALIGTLMGIIAVAIKSLRRFFYDLPTLSIQCPPLCLL